MMTKDTYIGLIGLTAAFLGGFLFSDGNLFIAISIGVVFGCGMALADIVSTRKLRDVAKGMDKIDEKYGRKDEQ